MAITMIVSECEIFNQKNQTIFMLSIEWNQITYIIQDGCYGNLNPSTYWRQYFVCNVTHL